MLDQIFSSGLLNLVYGLAVVISFIFALVSLVGAELGDIIDLDLDTDGGMDFINISPFALAMFGTAFGVVGLITRVWFEMSEIPSILWAAGAGVVVGGLSQAIFFYVLSASKSSHFSLQEDAVGREAEVITSVPQSGLGEIAFNNVSGRVKLGARSSTGEKIETGGVVVIERIVGRVAFVRRAQDES